MKNSVFEYVKYQNELQIINEAAKQYPSEFVKKTEQGYRRNIRKIAAQLCHTENTCKVILLAGPSSSGKTTTAHMLAEAFEEFLIHAEIISLDDFYRGEKMAPVLPNGQHDYESVDALDIPHIQQCLLGLLTQNHCDMPVFNFETHTPYPYTRHVELKPHDIAIVEGIHALNPVISCNLPQDGLLKVYISVKQGIISGEECLLSANDMRLVRRIVRDNKFRNSLPERTLSMWENVMDGEYKYIKPFRKDAHITINSLHLYEPCLLQQEAVPLLKSVDASSEYYKIAQKLLHSMERFVPILEGLSPKTSMLREFIGGGIYS